VRNSTNARLTFKAPKSIVCSFQMQPKPDAMQSVGFADSSTRQNAIVIGYHLKINLRK